MVVDCWIPASFTVDYVLKNEIIIYYLPLIYL